MKLIYHGHACFEVRGTEEPKSIIFDPYGSGTCDTELKIHAGLALCSHDHFDHNNCSVAEKCLLATKGDRTIGSAVIKGVEVAHDPKGGSLRGKNIIYVVKYGGKIFVHLGDLGHILTEGQVKEILSLGRPDLLFVPVGGVYTIGPKEALDVIAQLRPRIAVPMHYKHKKLDPGVFGRLSTLDDFLKMWKGEVVRAGSNTWDIPDKLPEETKVLVLEFP